jgi:hypothetical protein
MAKAVSLQNSEIRLCQVQDNRYLGDMVKYLGNSDTS